jgi:putative inorganic carbon (HCO3(-)) transporter
MSLQFRGKAPSPSYKLIMIGLLLLSTPFLLFPGGYRLLALLLLPAIWLMRWALVGRVTPQTPLDWPILLILVMILVSMWATFDLSFSMGKITGLLLGIILYYAIVDLAGTEASLKVVITIFFLFGVALAIISALGTRWLYKLPLIEPLLSNLPRVFQGIPGAEEGFHPNQVGGVLILFIPLQVVSLIYWIRQTLPRSGHASRSKSSLQGIRRDKIADVLAVSFTGLSLLITAGVLLLTQSRGAIGGLAVGLVSIAAIRTRWGKVLAVFGLVALLVAIGSGALNDLATSNWEPEVTGTLNLASRLEIWSRALQGLRDFPFSGMGMNTFRRVMLVLYPAFSFSPTWNFGHAHNHLLQVGLDLGIPGLVAYLALWLGAGFLLGQTVLQARPPYYKAVALGLIGSFIAHFVYGLTDTVALGAKPGFVFWWALGLVAATHHLFYRDKLIS